MSTQLTPQNAPDWMAWLTNFDKARKTWLDSWHALKSRTSWIERNAPQLLAEHKRVMQRFLDQVPEIEKWERFRHNLIQGFSMIGVAIKNVADATGITSAVDWIKGAVGLRGYDVTGRHGLGAVQGVWLVFSIGAALALLTAMAGVANDGFKHVTRIDALKAAMERGASPEQAAELVNRALGNPADQQFLGLPIREALLAAVLIFVGPPLVRAISERRK